MMAASRVRCILLRRPGQGDGRDHNFPPWEAVYQQTQRWLVTRRVQASRCCCSMGSCPSISTSSWPKRRQCWYGRISPVSTPYGGGSGDFGAAFLPRSTSEQRGGSVSEPLRLALQRIREARGLTIEELAQKSGVAALTIRDTERGESTPCMDTIARLAKPLGLTIDEVWSLQRRRE